MQGSTKCTKLAAQVDTKYKFKMLPTFSISVEGLSTETIKKNNERKNYLIRGPFKKKRTLSPTYSKIISIKTKQRHDRTQSKETHK